MEENTAVEEKPEGDETVINDPKAVLEALDRAKKDAKKYREQFEALENANAALTERLASLEGDDRVVELKRRLIELTAKSELGKKGIKDVERIYSLMDAEALDLDDDGGLSGLDEGLTSLKNKLPELFDEKKRVAGAADGFAGGQVKQQKSTTEIQLERLKHHN